MELTSEAWLACGRMLFTNDLQPGDFSEDKELEPTPFSYCCHKCQIRFESAITPTKCPNGCLASELSDPVWVTHKGYRAATFPFH